MSTEELVRHGPVGLHRQGARVLHFSHVFLPTPGGRTTRLYNLIKGTPEGHHLVVPVNTSISFASEGVDLEAEDSYGNIRVSRRELQEPRYKLRLPIVNYLRYAGNVARQLTELAVGIDFDLVHGHDPLSFAWAAMKTAGSQRPFVYEAHTLIAPGLFEEMRYRRIPAALQRVGRYPILRWERRVLRAAHAIVVQTQSMKTELLRTYHVPDEKVKVVPNGVDSVAFDPDRVGRKREAVRGARGWHGKFVCMYSGHLDEVNGVDFLIRAADRFPNALRDRVRWVFLGRGPLANPLEKAAAHSDRSIEYLGLVPQEEMPAYYAACDLFVIPRPSTIATETLVPVKLLEALAMERPVLVSSVGGLTEVVRHDQNGLVFRTGQLSDLVRQVILAVDKPEGLSHLTAGVREGIVARYDWSRSRDLLQGVYQEIGQLDPRAR